MTTYYIKDANGNLVPVNTTPIGAQPSAQSISMVHASDALAEPGGAPITGAAMPAGGVGLTGWLSAIWKAGTGTQTVAWSGQSVSLSGNLPSFAAPPTVNLGALNGAATDANLTAISGAAGAAAPALASGASGLLGWLRKIVDTLAGGLTVSWTGQSVAATQSGTWNIGSIATLPSLPAGSNAIGNVGVSSLPSLPAGSNAIGNVGVNSLPALPAGSNNIGSVTAANRAVGAANVAPAQVSVGTTAMLLAAARTGAVGIGRIAATIFNNGAAPVFVGGAGVTIANGFPVPAGVSITINTTAALYGISGATGQNVGVLESY